MKRFLYLALLTIFQFCEVYGGTTGKISGRVVDQQSGEGLPAANVILQGTQLGASTDLDGFYYIINVPVGNYTLEASIIGYKPVAKSQVNVTADFTTRVNFNLNETVEAGEAVTVIAERPIIQKDLTSTRAVVNADELKTLPVTDLLEALTIKNGITAVRPVTTASSLPAFGQFLTIPGDGLHFRGGRDNETAYNVDGMSVEDPIWGGFQIDNIAENGLAESVVYSGTFNAEYGEAMSAVVNMVTQSPDRKKYKLNYSGYSGVDNVEKNTYNSQLLFSGPVPLSNGKVTLLAFGKYFSTDGYLHGFILPNWVDSRGIDKNGPPLQEVPMNYKDNYNGMAKLQWDVTRRLKFTAGLLGGHENAQVYNHFFKYDPYGAPHTHTNEYLAYGKLTHSLSNSTFYTLGFGRYDKRFKSHVFDTVKEYSVLPDLSGSEFAITGEDFVFFDSESQTNQLRLDLTSQVTNIHQLKFGLDARLYNIDYQRRNPGQVSPNDSTEFFPQEIYHREPNRLTAFLQDKMEFNELGMILNLGFRYDRVNPKADVLEDLTRPITSSVKKASVKDYFSPRIGISYPITDQAAFHFSYGHFFQFPNFFQLYQKQNDEFGFQSNLNLSDVLTAVGNSDMKPEKTISYEAGVNFRLGGEYSLSVIGFFREITDLIGSQRLNNNDQGGFQFVFDNKDFADVKGVELSLNKRYSNHFSGSINYTFTQTRVSSQNVFFRPTFPLFRTQVAEWDQPHVLSINVDIRQPGDWGVNILGSFSSGFPYTFDQFEPNSERGPSISTIDMKLEKQFKFFGSTQNIFVQVLNVFDTENAFWVYPDTGIPGFDNQPSTSDDSTFDPSAFGPARRIRIGGGVSF